MELPEVRYARTGDGVSVAYQVFGEGPVDLLFVWGWVSNVDLIWDHPRSARFLRRLGSFSRVISFDKRGTGLSDPVDVGDPPHVETRISDLSAVLEAAGSQRAAVLGFSEGGATALMFAATYPERVSSLVLWGAFPRPSWAEDYLWGETREESLRRWVEPLSAGRLPAPEELFPDAVADPATRHWLRRYTMNSATPAMHLALLRMNGGLDVRAVLPVSAALTTSPGRSIFSASRCAAACTRVRSSGAATTSPGSPCTRPLGSVMPRVLVRSWCPRPSWISSTDLACGSRTGANATWPGSHGRGDCTAWNVRRRVDHLHGQFPRRRVPHGRRGEPLHRVG